MKVENTPLPNKMEKSTSLEPFPKKNSISPSPLPPQWNFPFLNPSLTVIFQFFEDFSLGKTSNKKNGKENDIVQKGGEVSEKYQILNVLLKVTFY